MNDLWSEFCKKENENIIKDFKKRIKKLEKSTKGKEIKKFKIGEYKSIPYSCDNCPHKFRP